jgi:hypothetical protein
LSSCFADSIGNGRSLLPRYRRRGEQRIDIYAARQTSPGHAGSTISYARISSRRTTETRNKRFPLAPIRTSPFSAFITPMRANMESTNGYGELIGRRRVQPLRFSEQRYCRSRVYCWLARLIRCQRVWPVRSSQSKASTKAFSAQSAADD